ncbi:MAG: ABC transporter ATP-binding protein [Devosia sp.]|nr:ABC transporter ATP-binding protein [Devosiaceae bacterium]
MAEPVLAISGLRLGFRRGGVVSQVLHGISLNVRRGEKVALVGESGSGKSVTARLVMGLLQETRGVEVSGRILFDNADVTRGGKLIAAARGDRVSMIFQDPTSALNPVFRIGQLFREVLRAGGRMPGPDESRRIAIDALAEVRIPDPERCLASYPFQLSGGMNQRVLIAMALVNRPALLIADEPGTALDVTVQAQTLRLMDEMTQKTGTAVLFISHNLGVVREFADRVYVIYRGRIVEHATAAQLFADPRHPYTQALLQAVPKIVAGGLPEPPEQSPRFLEPLIVHEGCGEPEEAAA